MKKVLSILLSVAMIVLCFAACGKTDSDTNTTGKAANVKVGFIFLHDENSTYDRHATMQQPSLLTKDATSSLQTASVTSLI